MKNVIVSALLALAAYGQTATTPVSFPAIPLPTAVAAFGSFNQLGSPRFTGGVAALYPVVGSFGIYGTSTADFFPKLATDPASGKHFYAISAAVRQGFHKDVLDTGRFSFLVGGDMGPAFSSVTGTSSISVSFSSSFVATVLYQASPAFSFIAPIRMLYVSGVGWNPVLEAGVVINLKNLPKANK